MSRFYTYFHTRNDTGKIFYVGKGKDDRAYDFRRNDLWNKITAKHGREVLILEHFECEEDALAHERYLIASLKSLGFNLANMTDGGEGISGFEFTQESKSKMSASQLKRFEDPEQREAVRISKLGKPRATSISPKLSALFKGKPHSPEWNAKVSASMMGNQKWLGKKHSAESIEKMRASRKAFWDKKKASVNGN